MAIEKTPINWRRNLNFGIVFVAAVFMWAVYRDGGHPQSFRSGVSGLFFWSPMIAYAVLGLGGTIFCAISFLCFRARGWRGPQPQPDMLRSWFYLFLAQTSLGEWATLNRWEAGYFGLAYFAALAWAVSNVISIQDTTPVMAFCGNEKLLCKVTSPRALFTLVFATMHVLGIFTLLFIAKDALAVMVRRRSGGRYKTGT